MKTLFNSETSSSSTTSSYPVSNNLTSSPTTNHPKGEPLLRKGDERFEAIHTKSKNNLTSSVKIQNKPISTTSANLVKITNQSLSVKEVQELKEMLISYHDSPTSAAHSWKEIKMFNRWGNDTKEEYLENIKNQIKDGSRALIFYDTTTNSKRHLKTLAGHENITLVSYEALRAHFSKKKGGLAQRIANSIGWHKRLIQCNQTGHVVDEQLLLDSIIFGYLCDEMNMLDNNSFLLKHGHMTKTYDEKWVDAAVEKTQGKKPIQAVPNVYLVTPLSQEALKVLISAFETAPISMEMITRFKEDAKTNRTNKSERIEIDKQHLNRADNQLGYGNLSLYSDSATYYATQHTALSMNEHFQKQIDEEKDEFQYVNKRSEKIVKCQDGTRWSLLTDASWTKDNTFDSLDKILDAMITVLQLKGKLETAKMLPIAREVTENPSLTEEALMQKLKSKITKRGLTSKDFHTKKLIVKSTSEEVLKTLATIPSINRKFLNVNYTENSMHPKIKKYFDYPMIEALKKRLMFLEGDSIDSEQSAISSEIDISSMPFDYAPFAYKKPYKNAITAEDRANMIINQHEYNEHLKIPS